VAGLGAPERGEAHTGDRPHFHSWGWLAASPGSFELEQVRQYIREQDSAAANRGQF
jgi:hypothetical protein